MSHTKAIEDAFYKAIADHRMLLGQRGILLGYSGGADSTALLHLLNRYCLEHGLALHALHVHHGIRGSEADRDAAFCRIECERLGVDFTLEHADIPRMAEESGRGVEETARAYRYEAFARMVHADERLSCIATAHNADDNAETILFHLTRGSGIDGLCGIPPVREHEGIRVIRPLIAASKRDILGYCGENRIEYIFDSTNEDTAYTRNYIRREILPRLTEINPAFTDAARRLSENLRRDGAYLDRTAQAFVAENCRDGRIDAQTLTLVDEAIASRAVTLLFGRLSARTLESVHIDAVLSLAKTAKNGSSVSMPGGVRARIDGGRLYFTDQADAAAYDFRFTLHAGINRFERPDFAVSLVKKGHFESGYEKDNLCLKNIYKLSIHTQVNSDKINHVLYLRSRCAGDAYIFGGMTRRLKKLYNDRGIDADTRRRLPVFCDGEGIVWVPGFPAADRVRDDEGDLVITYYYN